MLDRQITVNDLPVGRSVEETIRLIQAFQFTVRLSVFSESHIYWSSVQIQDKHGEVCPANWTVGAKTIKADPLAKLEYFETTANNQTNPNSIVNGTKRARVDWMEVVAVVCWVVCYSQILLLSFRDAPITQTTDPLVLNLEAWKILTFQLTAISHHSSCLKKVLSLPRISVFRWLLKCVQRDKKFVPYLPELEHWRLRLQRKNLLSCAVSAGYHVRNHCVRLFKSLHCT